MIIDFLEEINEKTTESGKGSKAGREKYASKEGTKGRSVKARKSRVRIFPSIKAALQSEAPVGTIFSTENADRLYVITRQKWGTDKESQVGSRVAKGFTPGSATPAANWPSIKGYSARTKMRHGGATSKRLKARYGPGKTRPEERRYSGKKKIKEAACAPASKLNQILVLLKRVLLKKTRSMREENKVNPWAVCHSQLGKKKTDKFERCVMKVKAKHGLKEQAEFIRNFLNEKTGKKVTAIDSRGYGLPLKRKDK